MAKKMEVTFGQFGLILPSSRLLSIPQFLWKEQHMMENEDSCGISLWINLVTCPLCNVLLLKVPFEINKNVDVPCVMPLETRLLVVLEVVVILLLLCLHSSILLLPWLLMFPALQPPPLLTLALSNPSPKNTCVKATQCSQYRNFMLCWICVHAHGRHCLL